MRILIFSNSPYDNVPYNDWLINKQIVLFYIVDEKVIDSYNQIPNVISFPDYITTLMTELEAHKIVREKNINKIISRGEKDVLRASKIRDIFELEGMTFSESLYFRDKRLMKNKAETASIPIADYKVCFDALDIYEFSEIYKFPIIIKPILESGSTGVKLLKSKQNFYEELKAYNTSNFPLLAENYIEGKLYHIDTLVLHDEYIFSSVSEYTEAPLHFTKVPFRGSFTILSGELKERLEIFTKEVIAAFPKVEHAAYHTEIFVTKLNDLILCEIACRMPGARIVSQIELAYGINIDREHFMAECGEYRNAQIKKIISKENRISVQLAYYPKNGVLTKIEESIPNKSWIHEFIVNGIVGRRYHGAIKSGKGLITVVFSAENRDDIESKIQELNFWVTNNIQWEMK